MKITVFGSGYVGLVTGACLADVGHSVMCIDVDRRKIDGLNRGVIPIYEPGLEELILKNCKAGRLSFSTDAAAGVEHGYLQFIAVGTPPDEDGKADLRYVLEVAATIGRYMADNKVVIDKSTVPVGTADKVRERIESILAERDITVDFEVCSNPEFLKEGAAIEDFTKGARIVVGTGSAEVRDAMRHCYAPYNRNHDKLMFMDIRSAELTIRSQRNVGDEDQLHERDGGIGGAFGRRHRAGTLRHRFRPSYWLSLYLSRLWLWRLMFS